MYRFDVPIIKNIILNKSILSENESKQTTVKFEIDKFGLKHFLENDAVAHFDINDNKYVNYDMYDSETHLDQCQAYIEMMLNKKHKDKEIEYREFTTHSGKKTGPPYITKYDLVNYFTDEDIDSYPDFFIDLEHITESIIWKLYCDYIDMSCLSINNLEKNRNNEIKK
tara:strand:+ start:1888 stop:2391 length:504 start_codon:yes stop_codon:yes gene_type:complete